MSDPVRDALELRLDALLPVLPTAWQNQAFAPPEDGSAYQRVDLLRGQPENPVYGPGYREVGIMQVMLLYPRGEGSAGIEERARAIRAHFERGTTMTSGGVTVMTDRTPEIGTGEPDGDRWRLPVRVRWFANVF